MSERSKRISKLLESAASRASYIRAKLNVLIPSQIRALRLKRDNMTQKQLAELADMAQPRISKMERPGEEAFNIDTLIRLAAAFKVGLKVEFVPFSEMLAWENGYSQDAFNPTPIEQDNRFLTPAPAVVRAAFPSTWDEYAQLQRTFRQQVRLCYTRYTELANSGNILIGIAGAPAGLTVPVSGIVTYVRGSEPTPQLTEIQVTPRFRFQNIATAVQPVNQLQH